MKKLSFILSLLSIILLCSCANYKGDKVEKLVYKTIDYNGGYTIEYSFDFVNNTYSIKGYIPNHDYDDTNSIIKEGSFDEDEEIEFINGIYKSGLFRLKKEYNTLLTIIDGGGWHLEISFENGKTKSSEGHNASPKKIFDKCAIYFYNLCGSEVMGNIDEFLIKPDNLSVSLSETISENHYKYYTGFDRLFIANYKWNDLLVDNSNIYELNESKDSRYDPNSSFEVIFDTQYIKFSQRFKKFTLKSYDYNSELTNEEVLYEKKWFKKFSIDIEVNKIYVYTLEYKNGNYVSYTFSIKG